MIRDRDKTVLRDAARIAESENLRFFVIGAGARFLVYDWPNKLTGGRGTTDWDVAVRVSSWAEYERLRRALTAEGSPFRTTPAKHRLIHVDGRRLDLVPFGGVEGEDRTVTYPEGDTTHSVLGLSECEACCVQIGIGEGVSVRVVEAPGLILLKAKTYLDRRPDIVHDIRDLDFVARTYRDILGDAVVFERASDVLRDEEIDYEDVGAFLLARDILGLGLADEVVVPMRELVAELVLPQSKAVDDVLTRRGESQAQRRDAVVQRYTAFQKSLEPV